MKYPDEDKERKWKDVIRSSLRLCAVPIREGASYKEEDRGEVSSGLIDMQRLSTTLTKDTASSLIWQRLRIGAIAFDIDRSD